MASWGRDGKALVDRRAASSVSSSLNLLLRLVALAASMACPMAQQMEPIEQAITTTSMMVWTLTVTTNLSYFKTNCLNLRLFIPL